jgi:vacuolar protein sorting-associated protein 41
VIGSHLGAIHVLDWSGEEIRRIACHSTAVNDVDIDVTGEYVASCADDGKVSILSLFDGATSEFDFKLPVMAVALSPKYASNKKFAYGGKGEALVVSAQGWFGRSETVVHQGEGPITTIRVRHVLN